LSLLILRGKTGWADTVLDSNMLKAKQAWASRRIIPPTREDLFSDSDRFILYFFFETLLIIFVGILP